MNTEAKLEVLLEALNALSNMPRTTLLDNKNLISDIREIVSKPVITELIEDLKNERVTEKMAAINQSRTNANDEQLINAYVRYQSAAFGILSRQASVAKRIAYTEPMTMQTAGAFNARKQKNPLASQEIKSLKETKEFIEAFNSIYSNKALQIGTFQDPTTIGNYIDYSPYVTNYQYYLAIPTLCQTIDRPINMATKEAPRIKFEKPELSKEIEKLLQRIQFNKLVIKKNLKYAALSPRGSLTVPIEDNGRIRFNVFNDTQFTYATSYQYSRLDYRDNLTGVSQVYALGYLLQNEVTAHFNCPGFEPLYAVGKNRLFQLKDAAEAINIYLYTIKVLCIRAQVMVQKWAGEGQTDTKILKMRNLVRQLNTSLSLNTAITIPEDAELSILNNNLSPGFADVAPVVKDYQGYLSDMMPDYLYGSNTAYSANHFNMHATHQNIRAEFQEDQAEPIYRFCINSILMRDERFKKYQGEKDNFDIEFPSMYEPTEIEKEEIKSKKIDNLIKMADYPELEEQFKTEGCLREEFILQNLNNNNSKDEIMT